jgi:hypothetical protein
MSVFVRPESGMREAMNGCTGVSVIFAEFFFVEILCSEFHDRCGFLDQPAKVSA